MMRAAIAVGLLAAAFAVPAPALAEHHDEVDARNEAFAALPYWPGYWVSEDQAGTTITGLAPAATASSGSSFSVNIMSLRGDNAPWNEEGQRRRADVRARAGGRKATGWGYPMMMNSATPLRYLITPEETIIINFYNEARYIYTDGRPMPAEEDMWPTTYGTSIGRWEGDTLVIETVMVEDPSAFFHGSPPFSEEARYVERIRLDGDRLINEVTVTDPVTLTGPWTVTIAHVRDPGFDRQIILPWDNDRTGNEDGLNTIELAPVE
ncbi:hypothetical protein [Alteraurantiacibacter buctensis]|uniref:Uncharacterized protein n=1 Tax=Alteraurantiacibacter buctensis TaxID=1503981 RepID=A0A844Z087_9SPHN|nr:hypothetical protein [Alteraurantiacibacter buctensis]MXO72666.1 hypothetical protein [Alteraurantiacibacter buctensis]